MGLSAHRRMRADCGRERERAPTPGWVLRAIRALTDRRPSPGCETRVKGALIDSDVICVRVAVHGTPIRATAS